MQDNTRFKINSYLQLLKYVDDADLRNDLIDEIREMLQLMSTGKNYNLCCQKIDELFQNNDFLYANDVIQELKRSGFSESTIRRAKAELHISSEHNGYGADSKWIWIRGKV